MTTTSMRSTVSSCLVAVLLLVAGAAAQPSFEKRWHWSSADLGRSVAQTAAGGYLVSAETWSAVDGFGMLVACADCLGDTVWVRRVNGMATGSGYACLSQGNDVVLAGRDSSSRVAVYAFNSSGESVWSYTSLWRGQVSAVVPTADSGCLIVGRIPDSMYSFGAIRLDARGHERWARCYPASGTYETRARCAAQDLDSGFVICGDGYGYEFSYARIVRVTADGELVWSRLHRGQTGIALNSVAVLPGQGYVALGTDLDTLARQRALLIMSLDTMGMVVAGRHLVPQAPDVSATALRRVGNSFILAAALDWPDSARTWLVKTDAAGDTLWCRTLGRANRETPSDMIQSDDFGYAVVGSSDSFGSSVFLFKTDSLGRTATGIPVTTQPALNRVRLVVRPNPAAGRAFATFSLPGQGSILARLYDVAGKAVWTRSEQADEAEPACLGLDLDGLAAGTYLLRVQRGRSSISGRFVVR